MINFRFCPTITKRNFSTSDIEKRAATALYEAMGISDFVKYKKYDFDINKSHKYQIKTFDEIKLGDILAYNHKFYIIYGKHDAEEIYTNEETSENDKMGVVFIKTKYASAQELDYYKQKYKIGSLRDKLSEVKRMNTIEISRLGIIFNIPFLLVKDFNFKDQFYVKNNFNVNDIITSDKVTYHKIVDVGKKKIENNGYETDILSYRIMGVDPSKEYQEIPYSYDTWDTFTARIPTNYYVVDVQ
jgi:hypothetical protein